MISTKKQLKEVLHLEKNIYIPKENRIENIVVSDNCWKISRFVELLRKTEFHYNNKNRFWHKFLYICYKRKKNILGRKLGIEMSENSFDSGLLIYHSGNIVVNGYARIGKNCKLHGSNCIGNDGFSSKAPVIGDNVRLGVGAKVIGDVTIADDVIVAAGAVVIESCNIRGAVLAGVPAKCVKIRQNKGD